MKKHILSALALILTLAASCNKGPAEMPEAPICENDFVITATCGDPGSRTQRDLDGHVYWSPGDEIGVIVFDENGQRLTKLYKFVSTNEAPASTAKFVPAEEEFDYAAFKEIWDVASYNHIAVYPYQQNLSLGYESSVSAYSVRYNLSFSQTGVPGTFERGTYPSVAWSHDSNFSFKHPMSGLKFSIQSENVVKATMSVTHTGNNSWFAIHKNYLRIKEDGSVSCYTALDYDTETTDSLEMIPQGGTFTPGEAYYFVCPVSGDISSLTLTFERSDGSKLARAVHWPLYEEYMFKSSTFASMMNADNGCEWKTDTPVVNPATIEVGKAGGEITFGVKCAADYTVEFDADWLLEMSAEGDALSGTRTHTFVVKRNEDAARSATINVKNSAATVPVTVNQAAGEPLPNYPSIVRHHSALVVNNYSCAHYSVVNSKMRTFKNAHADMMEFTNIFTNSQYRDEPFNEPEQYNHNYYPDAVLDGRRKAEDEDEILKVFAETDALYPPMTSIGLSSSIEGTTLTIDLKVYAYKAGTYRISAHMGYNAQAMGNFNIYNVSRVHATDNPDSGIAGQEYELKAGMNDIHLTKTIKATYANSIAYLFVFAYVQAPYGDLPVLRQEDFKHDLYVDNCRYAAVGTTVEPEVN